MSTEHRSVHVEGDTLREKIAYLIARHPDWSSVTIAEVLDTSPEVIRSTASRYKIKLGPTARVPGRPQKTVFRRFRYAGYSGGARW